MSDLPSAPLPDAILEAAVYVDDLDAAERFYAEVLGLEVIRRAGSRHVFFRVGSTVLLVFDPSETEKPLTNSDLPVPPHGARGPGHVCFAMSREAIAAMEQRLCAAGVAVDAAFDWPNGARSLYVRDPAGNSVEFAEPRLWF
ncbi:VOC family protein [Sulfitobacter sp. LCG007]